MKTLHIIIILFLCFLFVSFTSADDANEKANDDLLERLRDYSKRKNKSMAGIIKEETVETRKVAILPFLNRASGPLAPVVEAIPGMLTFNLSQSKKLTVMTQTQIKKILEDFSPSSYHWHFDRRIAPFVRSSIKFSKMFYSQYIEPH